jgi:4-amino-4-deoxy-L-arabinose transferase-like glycosyltransferase
MGSAWGLYLGREGLGLSSGQSIVVGSVVIASGWVSFLGMEAHLFAFLLVVAVVLYFEERWLLTGVVVGLLFLTRGEGILLLPTFILYRLVTMWRKAPRLRLVLDKAILKILLGSFMVLCLWSFYAWSTFGQLLPNTLSAKMAQTAAGYSQSFLSRLVNEWMPLWGKQFALPSYPIVNLWWFLLAVGLIYIVTNKPQWFVFCDLDFILYHWLYCT